MKSQLWEKMRRTCRLLRYERMGTVGGLVGASHMSLLKTMQTGGRQWYVSFSSLFLVVRYVRVALDR
jgi:hypothetical protein